MKELTDKQQKVLNFLREHIKYRGMPPTVREIGQEMGFNFPAARGHLKALERKGHVKLSAGMHRGIELVDEKPLAETLTLPLAGSIRAGKPITAIEEIESYIAVDRELFRDPDAFVLRVTGESMQEAGIYDGDYVVVSQRSEVPQGGIGVAMVGGPTENEATVKRIYKEGVTVRLVPENSTMEPTEHPADEVSIIGRVTGVIRKL
jgi:repressor LexA